MVSKDFDQSAQKELIWHYQIPSPKDIERSECQKGEKWGPSQGIGYG